MTSPMMAINSIIEALAKSNMNWQASILSMQHTTTCYRQVQLRSACFYYAIVEEGEVSDLQWKWHEWRSAGPAGSGRPGSGREPQPAGSRPPVPTAQPDPCHCLLHNTHKVPPLK